MSYARINLRFINSKYERLRWYSTMNLPTVENTYCWNQKLRAFVEGNDPKDAIFGYASMRGKGVRVDSYTIQFVLKACFLMSGAFVGRQVHGHIIGLGFGLEPFLQTSLLKLYGLFGDVHSARILFDEMPQRDVVQWNSLIAVYSRRSQPSDAIGVVREMIIHNVRPNEVTVTSTVNACSEIKALMEGKQLHCYAIRNLMVFDVFVHNALISMYAGSGCLLYANRIFKRMVSRNKISWTTLISGYSQNGYHSEALDLFREMEVAGVIPDEVTMLVVISICAKLGNYELGKWVDGYLTTKGFHDTLSISNALIDMHSRCGNLQKSCWIFGTMNIRNVITWSAMIQALATHGHGLAALVRFFQMQREGFKPDGIVFLSLLNACSHAAMVDEGKQLFQLMIEEHGIVAWMEHYGSVVDILCRTGLCHQAFEFVVNMPLKPDIVIWRILIGASMDQGDISLSRRILDHILETEPQQIGNYIMKSNFHAMMDDWSKVHEVRSYMNARELNKIKPANSCIVH